MNTRNGVILCASCHQRLWAFRLLSNGQPLVFPERLGVPCYSPEIRQCPFCAQDIYVKLEEDGAEHFFFRDEETGLTLVS